MTFIKSLKTQKAKKGQAPLQIPKKLLAQHRFVTGQASLEYFILMATLALVTILSFGTFLPQARTALQGTGGFFQKAVLNGLDVDNDGG